MLLFRAWRWRYATLEQHVTRPPSWPTTRLWPRNDLKVYNTLLNFAENTQSKFEKNAFLFSKDWTSIHKCQEKFAQIRILIKLLSQHFAKFFVWKLTFCRLVHKRFAKPELLSKLLSRIIVRLPIKAKNLVQWNRLQNSILKYIIWKNEIKILWLSSTGQCRLDGSWSIWG